MNIQSVVVGLQLVELGSTNIFDTIIWININIDYSN